jgi:uncharacterized membrane protein
MRDSAFVEIEFYLLTLSSVFLPILIFIVLSSLRTIRRRNIAYFALILILLAAGDVVLLGRLAVISKASLSVVDDRVFASEISVALYLLPLVSAGLGVNLLSHILIRHLDKAEDRKG